MQAVRCIVLSVAVLALACGHDDPEVPPVTPGCAAPELALPDGSCIRPGVPLDGCAEGFVHDGEYGCEPVLPIEGCAPPLMAAPGDEACRSIMPCGEGTWGDIPVDATTHYVDGSYQGGNSNGSAAQPWTTIGEAMAAATSGSLVAVAAGNYVEDLTVDKSVRLWGVCPERVSVVGTGVAQATMLVIPSATDAELHGFAVSGPAIGVALVSAQNVTVDRVWIHDTGNRGFSLQNDVGPVSARMTGSLLSNTTLNGMTIVAGSVTVEDTVVVGTQPDATGRSGRGISVEPCVSGGNCGAPGPSLVQLNRVVVDGNVDEGVLAIGSQLDMDASVVVNTKPNVTSGQFGRGVTFQICGVAHGCAVDLQATGSVAGSLVANNTIVGIAAVGSEVKVERSVVRDNQKHATEQYGGNGIRVEPLCAQAGSCFSGTEATAEIGRSLVERNHDAGILLTSSVAVIEDTVIRGTLPSFDQEYGRGIVAQSCLDCTELAPSSVAIRRSSVLDNYEFGIAVIDSTAQVEQTVVGETSARSDGLFGDGIAASSGVLATVASVVGSTIADSRRAGVSNFGASVTLADSAVRCAAFALTTQDSAPFMSAFTEEGTNRCGCPETDETCHIESAQLEPPVPLPDRGMQ